MNIINDTSRQAIKRRHASSIDPDTRDCRYALDSICGSDVTTQYSAGLWPVDSALPLDPYDVDANDDRRHIFVERQHSPRMPQQHSTMADRNRPTRHCQRAGNTSRPNSNLHRHETADQHRSSINDTQAPLAPLRGEGLEGRGKRLLSREHARSGQALIEMAFLIPLLLVIIGATISFGLFFFQANVLQQAVDIAAQEISRFPFKPECELGLGDLDVDPTDTNILMNDATFKLQIYDEKYLVIHDSEWAGFSSFSEFANQNLPLLNRLLVPVMIRDPSYLGGVTRYPGAVVTNASGEETVLIPIISYDTTTGAESLINWVAPVEEIRPGGGEGPFSLNATNPAPSFVPGMVALRINYPAQSTTLINRTGDKGKVIIDADDPSIVDGNTGGNYSLVMPAESGPASTTIHSGRYGLGRQAALLRIAGVRPYRKVISVQAIYRREVFQ